METLEFRFHELVELVPRFEKVASNSIHKAVSALEYAFRKGNKSLVCGNGGSAADAQHFAAEFVNTFSRDLNRKALPVLALTTDSSILTSISNDFDFNDIFSRQVEAYGAPGDVFIAFTTSGSSKNCLNAVVSARKQGLTSIVFTRVSGEITSLADISIEVPSENTQHIQECHLLAYHVIAEMVEERLFR